MNKWYLEKGDQGDVVISTRIRLARNLDEAKETARWYKNTFGDGNYYLEEIMRKYIYENT